jgi:hypothetical protein
MGLVYAIVLLLIYRDYGGAFFKSSWITLKTFLLTRQWIYFSPGTGAKAPALRYALPIALGTLCTVLIKLTGGSLIQQVLGVQLSI